METDPKVIKNFGSYERKVRGDWAGFKASHMTEEQKRRSIADFQATLKALFSTKKGG